MVLDVRVTGNRISIGNHFSCEVQRTLRIPNDGKKYPLPPGLGTFPLFRVADYEDRVPESWRKHGGVFFPMWQREAAWINFHGNTDVPTAVLIGAGKVCAITGSEWSGKLCSDPQNYVLVGGRDGQRWIDGFKTSDGTVAQFVAMPLGMGYTVEKQLTGKETFGGIQIQVFECLQEKRPRSTPHRTIQTCNIKDMGGLIHTAASMLYSCSVVKSDSVRHYCAPTHKSLSMKVCSKSLLGLGPEEGGREMGLAAGGNIEQAIKKDTTYGTAAFDPKVSGRVYIHIVNSAMFRSITEQEAPATPISAKTYTDKGFPWFSTYEEDAGKDVSPLPALAGVKNVGQLDKEKGISGQQDDTSFSIAEKKVKKIGCLDPGDAVVDGQW